MDFGDPAGLNKGRIRGMDFVDGFWDAGCTRDGFWGILTAQGADFGGSYQDEQAPQAAGFALLMVRQEGGGEDETRS